MPPSGYNIKQSKNIVEFLDSISNELRKEGEELNLTPTEALKREIGNIEEIRNSDQFSVFSNIILTLTEWFYREILSNNADSYDQFEVIKKVILDKVEKDILNIHVPTIDF